MMPTDPPPPDRPHRPRDLALLGLSAGGEPPRQRARDQQADLAGAALRRRVLDRLAALDPEPGGLESALMQIVVEFGPPTGPTRSVALAILHEWQALDQNPDAWGWLLAEALAEPPSQRPRRGRGPEPTP